MRAEHPLPGQLPQLRQLWQEAFGDTEDFLDSFFRVAFSPRRCLCITVEGKVAAAAYWFDCGWEDRKCAYIYAVATGKEYRGQGLCRQLMEDVHRLLAERGYAGCVLVPGSDGLFAMYGAMGYRDMPGIRRITYAAGKIPAQLTKLTAEDYAQLRKKYLPAGSIGQEGENLAFLKEFYEFYRGDDFLLCCARDGSLLVGAELLGIGDHAGIVCALGCRKGSFRSPGGDGKFAMYYPLTPDFAPRYFAFAFD